MNPKVSIRKSRLWATRPIIRAEAFPPQSGGEGSASRFISDKHENRPHHCYQQHDTSRFRYGCEGRVSDGPCAESRRPIRAPRKIDRDVIDAQQKRPRSLVITE